mgnify:CR=1 FL=1|tara:strand:+ start:812 stop:1024 length:213 start_codon:yes stop_codon:yes gene_type:complete
MKFIYTVFISACFLLLSTNAGAKEQLLPNAVLTEPDYKFETILEGAEVNHTFRIKNLGNATLEITDVKTT